MAITTKIITPAFTFLLLCIVYAFLWMSLCFDHSVHPLVIDVGNPVINVTPALFNVPYEEGSIRVLSCERVPVSGVSRLKLQHYASLYNITLAPSLSIPKDGTPRSKFAFIGIHHRDYASVKRMIGDLFRTGYLSPLSPYEQKFVDVKYGGMVTTSVTVTLEEVQQRWRYILLAVGIVLLFVAPVVSEWVPFYYASSMVIGIITVVLIILYQARILLPTGRRNTFFLAIMGSVIGAGSYVAHHHSAFLNLVLLNFGISPEFQNLVCYFVGIGIILLGAALGYWLLQIFFISEDGEVYFGVAQFVKRSMFIVAITCIFLSSKDYLLALVAVGSCLALYHVIGKTKWCYYEENSYSGKRYLWARSKQTTPKHELAEFLGCSKKTSPLNGLINSFRWSNSLVKERKLCEEIWAMALCSCGFPTTIRTSWTESNPGRRFYCCAKQGRSCGFVRWFDPPICSRATQIKPGLLNSINVHQAKILTMQTENRRLKYMLGFTCLMFAIYYCLS